MQFKRILVTGGCGFIGSHFLRYLLRRYPHMEVINLDLLTYAGNPENVTDLASNARYSFYKGDIGDRVFVSRVLARTAPDAIVNFAAESDNNKAITAPVDFARTNVLGTAVLIDEARRAGVRRFHHVSTCEVYGQLPLTSRKKFSECSPLLPRTPYNASKAGGDLVVESYFHTFGFPVTISRCANNYGSHQLPEKVLPVFIIKALTNEPLTLFASTKNKREWIHVEDHCSAIARILEKGVAGEMYNIGTGVEKSIAELAHDVLAATGRPHTLRRIIPDRPGHDSRYLLDSRNMRTLGWHPRIAWESGLREMVAWYAAHETWWRPLLKRSHAWIK